MSEQAQQIFKRLLIHNKILNEEQAEALLAKAPDPEAAIQHLVKQHNFNPKTAKQLLGIYRKKIEEAGVSYQADAADDTAASSAAATSTTATSTTPTVHAPSGSAKQQVDSILQMARDLGASDLHITPGLPPVIRFATRLKEMDLPKISAEQAKEMVFSCLNAEQAATFEKDMDIDFCYDGGEKLGRFRANFLVEQNGHGGVFRLIDKAPPTLEELGMPATVKRFTEYAVGIVLITGPKGCGKTTTLASMVDLINRDRKEHIITIEDPVEFVHPCKEAHLNQREVGTHTKSFGRALRAALREAPDVIVVGEMRDLETTALAITAAETGHLVLATLHTPDTIRTIGRVLDVFPPKEQGQIRAMLSESLRGVVSQRLVPSVDGESLELAIEVLVNNTAVGNTIREDRMFQMRGLMQTGKKLGMILMDDSLLELVYAGKISYEEALEQSVDEGYFKKEYGTKQAKMAAEEAAQQKKKKRR